MDPLSLLIDTLSLLEPGDLGADEVFSCSTSGGTDHVSCRSNVKYHLVFDGDTGSSVCVGLVSLMSFVASCFNSPISERCWAELASVTSVLTTDTTVSTFSEITEVDFTVSTTLTELSVVTMLTAPSVLSTAESKTSGADSWSGCALSASAVTSTESLEFSTAGVSWREDTSVPGTDSTAIFSLLFKTSSTTGAGFSVFSLSFIVLGSSALSSDGSDTSCVSLSTGCVSSGSGCVSLMTGCVPLDTDVRLSFSSVSSGDLEGELGVDLLRVAFKSSSSSKKSWRPPRATIKWRHMCYFQLSRKAVMQRPFSILPITVKRVVEFAEKR